MRKISNLAQFQNVTLLLQHHYEGRKSQDPTFSYAVWAGELGIKSRSYLRLIVMGERTISSKLCSVLSRYFNFSEEEESYFHDLVSFSQSRNENERARLLKKLKWMWEASFQVQQIKDYQEFLSNPMLPPTLTLLSFKDLPASMDELAKLMDCKLVDLQAACDDLERLRLVYKVDGRYQPVMNSWSVPGHHLGQAHQEFYQNSLSRARLAINEQPIRLRAFRSIFAAMSESEFATFQLDFEKFLMDQKSKLNVEQIEGRRLYELNFCFYPSTQLCERKESGPMLKMNTLEA